jgi:hypothetical protein
VCRTGDTPPTAEPRLLAHGVHVGASVGRACFCLSAIALAGVGLNVLFGRWLEALEADILRLVHLENHVLAPRFDAVATPRLSNGATVSELIETTRRTGKSC